MQLGDTKIARNYRKYILHTCIDCGRQRLVLVLRGKPQNLRCIKCSNKLKNKYRHGAGHPSWRGGKTMQAGGYVLIKLSPDDFFYSMHQKGGYVLEHRLVMARHLGRCLHPWEIIHHKNGIRNDNGIENLQLVTDDRHKQITILENRIKYLEKRVILIEAENVRLEGILNKWETHTTVPSVER